MMGLDATIPYGESYGPVCVVPGTSDFEIPGWTDRQSRAAPLGAAAAT
jgi:hypothetical protein